MKPNPEGMCQMFRYGIAHHCEQHSRQCHMLRLPIYMCIWHVVVFYSRYCTKKRHRGLLLILTYKLACHHVTYSLVFDMRQTWCVRSTNQKQQTAWIQPIPLRTTKSSFLGVTWLPWKQYCCSIFRSATTGIPVKAQIRKRRALALRQNGLLRKRLITAFCLYRLKSLLRWTSAASAAPKNLEYKKKSQAPWESCWSPYTEQRVFSAVGTRFNQLPTSIEMVKL